MNNNQNNNNNNKPNKPNNKIQIQEERKEKFKNIIDQLNNRQSRIIPVERNINTEHISRSKNKVSEINKERENKRKVMEEGENVIGRTNNQSINVVRKGEKKMEGKKSNKLANSIIDQLRNELKTAETQEEKNELIRGIQEQFRANYEKKTRNMVERRRSRYERKLDEIKELIAEISDERRTEEIKSIEKRINKLIDDLEEKLTANGTKEELENIKKNVTKNSNRAIKRSERGIVIPVNRVLEIQLERNLKEINNSHTSIRDNLQMLRNESKRRARDAREARKLKRKTKRLMDEIKTKNKKVNLSLLNNLNKQISQRRKELIKENMEKKKNKNKNVKNQIEKLRQEREAKYKQYIESNQQNTESVPRTTRKKITTMDNIKRLMFDEKKNKIRQNYLRETGKELSNNNVNRIFEEQERRELDEALKIPSGFGRRRMRV